MPTLRILLIEDTPSDRVLFINQVQGDLGDDVVVDCAEKIGEAFNYLESATTGSNDYDQIWLDPGLPDLGQQHIAQVLNRLKKHVEPGQLRLLTSSVAPEVRRQAGLQGVEVINKEALQPAGNLEILAVVRELLEKRSSGGGTTMRVEQAKHEIRILNIEQAIATNSGRLERIEASLSQFSTVRFELDSIKAAISVLPEIKASLGELKKTQEQQGQLKLKRWDVLQAVAVAVLTGLLTVVVPKLIDQNSPKATPSPAVSVSPQK